MENNIMGEARRRKLSDPNYGQPAIQKFGELMLWDSRVEKYLKRCKNWHPEVNIYNVFGFNPNIYAVHSAKFNERIITVLSIVKVNCKKFNGGYSYATIALVDPEDEDNKTWDRKVKNEVKIYLDEEISKSIYTIHFQTQKSVHSLTSCSIMTLEILLLEANRAL